MSEPWPSTRSRQRARHAAPAATRGAWPIAAAFAVAIVGAAGVLVATLTGVGEAETTVERAAPPPAVIAAPVPAEPQHEQTNTATPAPSSAQAKPAPTQKARAAKKTLAECNRIAARSPLSNADLRPYLRSLGCDATADSLLVGSAGPVTQPTALPDPGKAALKACREQTGQTTAWCIDQSRRGLAN